jgi:hypothetical protein
MKKLLLHQMVWRKSNYQIYPYRKRKLIKTTTNISKQNWKLYPKTVAAQSEDREIAVEQVQTRCCWCFSKPKRKKVKDISVKWISDKNETGHLVKVNYGIEATLADGQPQTKSRWQNALGWFKITVKGGLFEKKTITIKMQI